MLSQRSVIDLGTMAMVSKMHILGLPGTTTFNVHVSEQPHSNYTKVTIKQTAKHNQNLRVVDLGSVPARFLMIEVTHGEPLPNDEEAVEIYGISQRSIGAVLSEDESSMLMDKAFKIIYGFNSGAAAAPKKKCSKRAARG